MEEDLEEGWRYVDGELMGQLTRCRNVVEGGVEGLALDPVRA